ncbi:helix-turn-helix domain-containing protein [Nocardia terpenica]|uniref:Uncharacterized protein n=1 Tax=Nocardia terpenica TaxID=455432 RepID=A0A291RBZ4_9NOCA|nr:helix-turn-helix domain-containing protein [Nocardia terpenica]ATL64926.1 hypothetical protein CRH09_00435 [Nocardia terpenica]
MNDNGDQDHYDSTHDELAAFYDVNPDLRPGVLEWGDLRKPEDRWAVATMITLERKARDVTQAKLAEVSGVSLRTIKYIDAGDGSPPKASTLAKLWDGLVELSMDSPRTDTGPVQMLADVIGPMYQALTPQQQAEALRRIVLLLNEIKEQ